MPPKKPAGEKTAPVANGDDFAFGVYSSPSVPEVVRNRNNMHRFPWDKLFADFTDKKKTGHPTFDIPATYWNMEKFTTKKAAEAVRSSFRRWRKSDPAHEKVLISVHTADDNKTLNVYLIGTKRV